MSNSCQVKIIDDIQIEAPSEWKTIKFGDVAKKVNITVDPRNSGLDRYIAGEHMQTDDLHIKKWGTIGDDYLGPAFNKMFKKGQILYGSRRTYLRKIAIPHFDGICSNTTFILEPKGTDLLPELLPFVMQSVAFTEHSIRESKGSTNPYINWKDITKYQFEVPVSMDRQREIADILLAAEDAIVKTEIFIENAERYKTVLMRNLFSEGIQHSDTKYDEKIGNIPIEWDSTLLSDLIEVHHGYAFKSLYFSDVPNNIIVLVPGNFHRNGGLYFGERNTNYYTGDYDQKFLLKNNDLLIVMTDLSPKMLILGRIVKLNTNELILHNQRIGKIELIKKDLLHDEFLLHLFNSDKYRNKVKSSAAGSGVKHTSPTSIKSICIPLPPLQEQEKIASVLNNVTSLLETAYTSLHSTSKMKMHLINYLLSGSEQE